jgi:hypothetical protein
MSCILHESKKVGVQQFHWLGLDMVPFMETVWHVKFLFD